MSDPTVWSGSGKGLIHLSEDERAQYDSEEQRFNVRRLSHAQMDRRRQPDNALWQAVHRSDVP